MTKEAMKLAFEKFAKAKELCDKHGNKVNRKRVYGGALIEHFDVVCQALAEQPAQQQEPVALKPCWYESKEKTMCRKCGQIHAEAIPTAAQQEPLGYLYELIVEGQVVNEKFTSVNWDTRYEPFGRNGVDHGGEVTKTPLYTSPPTLSLAQRQARSADTWVHATAWRGLTDEELRKLCEEFWLYPRKLLQAIEAKLKAKNSP